MEMKMEMELRKRVTTATESTTATARIHSIAAESHSGPESIGTIPTERVTSTGSSKPFFGILTELFPELAFLIRSSRQIAPCTITVHRLLRQAGTLASMLPFAR